MPPPEASSGPHSTEIAVIGGGVIGLAIALRLAKAGHDVLVIEPNTPGSGASYGNAATIANYAVLPVGTPSVLRKLPALLFDRDSPLTIRAGALPGLAPWLLRFARASLPATMRRNAAVLADLLADSVDLWRELTREIGAAELLRESGCLYLYESEAALRATASDDRLQEELGVVQQQLGPDAVARLEPDLPPLRGGGVFYPQAASLGDPGLVMQRLLSAAQAAGVQLLAAQAQTLERRNGRIQVSGGETEVEARRVVIAAGARSRRLAAMAGDPLPLDTERGYHVEYDMTVPPVRRPVCRAARGFYFVPLEGRLRVAGTVELGGLSAPADPRRIALLHRGAREFFPHLGEANRSWLGFRPSMPDSLPVIRPSRRADDVLLAFGHGHLGLTLAPVTAQKICRFIDERQTH